MRACGRVVAATWCAVAGVMLGTAGGASGQIAGITLLYDTNYIQTGPSALGTGYSTFIAQLDALTNAVEQVSVYVEPDDSTYDLSGGGGGSVEIFSYVSPSETSQASLLSYFGQGNYIFEWSGGTAGTGSATITQPYANGLWASTIPRFSATTWANAQGMNPALPMTFSVASPFVPSGLSQYTRGGITIRAVNSSFVFFNTLTTGPNATASSIVVPANTLQPNTTYAVSWMFAQGRTPTVAGVSQARVQYRYQTEMQFTTGAATPACDDIDFNNNEVFPEDQDVIDFFDVLAGGDCPACNDVDFNNNGVFPEDQDVIDFFTVLAGGTCP